jgi:hypothetical protein
VSTGCIRQRGDVASRPSIRDARDAEGARFLDWWYLDDGRRLGLEAELPAAEGAVVARTIEGLASTIPAMPGGEDACYAPVRRADALVALCSSAIASDPDPDRATVVIHAELDALVSGDRRCEIEGGGMIHPETARRLLCTARLQGMIEDRGGNPVRLGRHLREPPGLDDAPASVPGSGVPVPGVRARRFTKAHHIRWWEHGGPTDLDNLLLVCTFHHKLVHEHGWAVRRHEDGTVRWFRPDGGRYRTGPAPPGEAVDPQPVLAAVGS